MLPSIFTDNIFDDFFGNDFARSIMDTEKNLYGRHAKNLMKTDVKECKDHYEVSIDLPGFKKDEITVDLKDGYLTVAAAKGLDKDEQSEDEKYIRRERYAGSCQRSFYVGDVRPEDIKGKFESGVLTVSVPKMQEQLPETPSRIAIE